MSIPVVGTSSAGTKPLIDPPNSNAVVVNSFTFFFPFQSDLVSALKKSLNSDALEDVGAGLLAGGAGMSAAGWRLDPTAVPWVSSSKTESS